MWLLILNNSHWEFLVGKKKKKKTNCSEDSLAAMSLDAVI